MILDMLKAISITVGLAAAIGYAVPKLIDLLV